MTTIDEIARQAAAAARADAASMARTLTDSGLERLRSNSAPVTIMRQRSFEPRRWIAIGAAAALAAAAIVAIVLGSDHGDGQRLVPATDQTSVVAPSTTVADTEPQNPSTTIAATTLPERPVDVDAISVSYDALPPAYPAQTFATVDIPGEASTLPLAAVTDFETVLVEGSSATLIDNTDSSSAPQTVPLQVNPVEAISVGPDDVLYAFVQSAGETMSIDAIALSGDRAGQVITSAPVSRIFSGDHVRNTGVLGHGPDGIIDRETGAQLIEYVDSTGAPTTFGRPAHQLSADGALGSGVTVVHDPDGAHDWRLDVRGDPQVAISLVGYPGPYPAAHDGAVLSTLLDATHSVIAVLAADGTGTWYSLNDGWRVGASDVAGGVLMRRNGDTVELARLDPPQRLDFLDQPMVPHERVEWAATLPTTLTSATPCTVADLDVQPSVEGAMGTTYGTLNVRNTSDQPCQVQGVPDVAYLDAAGNVVQSTDPSLLGQATDAVIVLELDSWANALLGAIASNVCGGNQSSQFRLTIGADSVTLPLDVGRPVDAQSCEPPSGQTPGPGQLAAQAFAPIQDSGSASDIFDGLEVSADAPASVRAGDVLRYDVTLTSTGNSPAGKPSFPVLIDGASCPVYTETLFPNIGGTDQPPAASGQLLLNCDAGAGISIAPGETVVFHIELPIPADAPLGPATLTWTPVEPAGPAVTATITVTA